MKIKSLLLSSTICLSLLADDIAAFKMNNQTQQFTSCGCSPDPVRFGVRHIEAKGLGYKKGYTTLEIFLSQDVSDRDTVPFIDVRGHVFNDGKFAANAGFGFRHLIETGIFGANFYYDYRKTKHRNYNQFGTGLEYLRERFEARLNGYFPFGKMGSRFFDLSFDSFQGHNMFVKRKQEVAMTGVDGEIGYHMNKQSSPWDIYGAVGPYYFVRDHKHAFGGEARLLGRYNNWFFWEATYSYDNLFKNIVQGEVGFNWNFGPKSEVTLSEKAQNNCLDCCDYLILKQRLVQPVIRDEIIVATNRNKKKVAIDPVTGLPYYFIFVNNTSSSLGTFESPYPTLALAQANSMPSDVIYVMAGNGTTSGMNSGIVLQANQKLLGAGMAQPIATTVGTVSIPAFSTANPVITNTSGSAITLASGNQVTGFNITLPSANGIVGTNVNNVVVSQTTIFGAQSNGISITESGSTPVTLIFDGLFVTNSVSDGLFLNATNTSNVNVTVSYSNFSSNGQSSGRGVALRSQDTAFINANVHNNILDINATGGLDITSSSNTPLTLSYLIKNNSFEGNNGYGITGTYSGNAPVLHTITGNSLVANHSFNGAIALTYNGSGHNSLVYTNNLCDNIGQNGTFSIGLAGPFVGTFENSSFNHCNSYGLLFNINGTFPVQIDLDQIESQGNIDHGIEFNNNALSTVTLNITDSDISGNFWNGIDVTGATFQTFNMNMTDTRIDGCLGANLNFGPTVNTLNLTATGNTFSAALQNDAIILHLIGANILFDNNLIAGAHVDGIRILSQDSNLSNVNAIFTNNTFDSNQSNNLDFTGSNRFNQLNVVIENNSFLYAGTTNINLSSDVNNLNGVIANNTLNGSQSSGSIFNMINGTLLIDGNQIDGAFTTGIQVGSGTQNFLNATVTISNNSISGGNTGINLTGAANNLNYIIENNNINYVRNHGMNITPFIQANALINGTLINNVINYTSANGIDVAFPTQGASSTTNMQFINNTTNYNFGIGLSFSDFQFFSSPNCTINLGITGHVAKFNTSDGIQFRDLSTLATNVPILLQGNTLSNNTGAGVNISSSNGHNNYTITANNNLFSENQPYSSPVNQANAGMLVTNNSGTATVCLEMSGNNSDTGYLLTRGGGAGTFKLVPLNVDSINMGIINRNGGAGMITTGDSCP